MKAIHGFPLRQQCCVGPAQSDVLQGTGHMLMPSDCLEFVSRTRDSGSRIRAFCHLVTSGSSGSWKPHSTTCTFLTLQRMYSAQTTNRKQITYSSLAIGNEKASRIIPVLPDHVCTPSASCTAVPGYWAAMRVLIVSVFLACMLCSHTVAAGRAVATGPTGCADEPGLCDKKVDVDLFVMSKCP